MSISLLTLNIEADRHLDRVRSTIGTYLPDVVCLQEALESDCADLAAVGGYQVKYAVSARLPTSPSRAQEANWGVAVLSRLPVQRQTVVYYADDPEIRVLREPNDPRRVIVVTEFAHQLQSYRIITTHFTWSAGGEINQEQRAEFERLKQVLAPYPDFILCGDFNAPRGKEMFAKFTNELKLIDHLPANVTTTIDPHLHYAGALNLVVDTIFSTPEYRVSDIQVLEGVSDHKGIFGRVHHADSPG